MIGPEAAHVEMAVAVDVQMGSVLVAGLGTAGTGDAGAAGAMERSAAGCPALRPHVRTAIPALMIQPAGLRLLLQRTASEECEFGQRGNHFDRLVVPPLLPRWTCAGGNAIIHRATGL